MLLNKTRWIFLPLICLLAAPALGDEADDLQLMIDRERRSLQDLRRLDELRSSGDDISTLEKWLNEAWKLRGEEDYEAAKVVLERVDAQKDMVREKIAAARLKAEASKVEADLAIARKRIKALKKELAELSTKKANMGEKAQ
jgi:hypothetical protein